MAISCLLLSFTFLAYRYYRIRWQNDLLSAFEILVALFGLVSLFWLLTLNAVWYIDRARGVKRAEQNDRG
jgi:hypothetical protein